MSKRHDLVNGEGTSLNDFAAKRPAGRRHDRQTNPDHMRRSPDLSIPAWHLRSRTNQALISAEVQEHCNQLWSGVSFGFIVVDVSGSIVCMNDPALKLCMQAQSRGSAVPFASCISAADVAPFHEFLSNVFQIGVGQTVDVQIAAKEAQNVRRLRVSATSVGTLTAALILEDITDLKRLETTHKQTEEHLRQTQRLELVHAMSAGIAHDFKNVMHVIETYAGMLNGQELPANSEQAVSAEILTAATRGALLANRWLAFCRRGELVRQCVDIGLLVNECLTTIEHALLQSIHLEKQLDQTRLMCALDPCLVEQVLINLCLNARDAMTPGGVLRVAVARIVLGNTSIGQQSLSAGVYAKISVADNGRGIPPELLDQVFEPFFTSKEPTVGTGLGLTLARGIIAEHGGAIEVRSEVGVGSVFTVYLPALSQAVEPGK